MTRRKILNKMKRKTRKTKKKTLKKMMKEIQIMEEKMILKTKMTMTPMMMTIIDIEAVFLEIRLTNGRKYRLLSQKLHRGQRSESQYRINSKD